MSRHRAQAGPLRRTAHGGGGVGRSWLRRQVGGTTVSALALTLLVLGCVFVAVAGPRYSLHSRTRALQHELAAVPPVDRAVQVTDDWFTFANTVSNSTPPTWTTASSASRAARLPTSWPRRRCRSGRVSGPACRPTR